MPATLKEYGQMVAGMADIKLPQLHTAVDVLGFIEDHTARTMFRGETQEFLPKPFFDIITSETVVRRLISADDSLELDEKEARAFARQIVCDGPKMYATCILGELPLNCVKALFAIGLTDEKFPFEEKDFLTHRKFQSGFFLRRFMKNQMLFNPAFISPNSDLSWDNRIAKPINFQVNDESIFGMGAFENVYKIQLHPGQHSLSSVSYDPMKGTAR